MRKRIGWELEDMDEMMPERTPYEIAAEINVIKYQTGKIILSSIIEIGKRLSEAKLLLPHGNWGKWLEQSVSYPQKTATNYMNIAEAYGDYLSAPPESAAQVMSMPNLNYTQALVLLGIPKEERAQFIVDMGLENMSTRELQKTVDELKKAKQEKTETEQKNAELKQALDSEKDQNKKLKKERDDMQAKATELEIAKQGLQQDVGKKQTEISKLKETSLFKSYKKVSSQLSAAQVKLATNHVASKYEIMDRAFKELTYELDLLQKIDKDVHGEYKKMLKNFLLKALDERIGN
jgi:hypothetical protein